jgi:hypothetical protein
LQPFLTEYIFFISNEQWFNLPGRIFFNRGCLEEGLLECGKAYANGDKDQRVIIVSGRVNERLGEFCTSPFQLFLD